MTLRCLLFGHDVNAVPVLRGSKIHAKCGRCGRISSGVEVVTRATPGPPVVYESRQILRLVKRA